LHLTLIDILEENHEILGYGSLLRKPECPFLVSSQAYPSGLEQLRYEIVQQPDVSQKVKK